jgi:hypothetical protein
VLVFADVALKVLRSRRDHEHSPDYLNNTNNPDYSQGDRYCGPSTL